MAENQKIQQIDCTKVPEPTLRRLPWYLSNVKLLKQRGCLLYTSDAADD